METANSPTHSQRTLFPGGAVWFNDLAKAEAFPDANLVQLSTYAELGVIPEPQLVQLRETFLPSSGSLATMTPLSDLGPLSPSTSPGY